MRRSSPIARGEAAIFNRGGGARPIGLNPHKSLRLLERSALGAGTRVVRESGS
jgi:hypothetical protein